MGTKFHERTMKEACSWLPVSNMLYYDTAVWDERARGNGKRRILVAVVELVVHGCRTHAWCKQDIKDDLSSNF